MAFRRIFLKWLWAAAIVLPLWLLVGWGVFQASGWAFLWVLFIAIPSVFIGQLVLTLLVRARAAVRASGAVSWWDVAGFTVWHGLTVAVGFYNPTWFAALLVAAIAVALGLLWLQLWQLWRGIAPAQVLREATAAADAADGDRPRRPTRPDSTGARVIVIEEGPSQR